MGIKGTVEVVLEDQYGRVKQRERANNTVTLAARDMALWAAMYYGWGNNLTRVSSGAAILESRAFSSFGIYTMNRDVIINPLQCEAPYVDDLATGVHPDVSFYNVDGGTVETGQEMVPNNARCFLDTFDNSYTIEYTKTSGGGTVKSIILGRGHANVLQSMGRFARLPNVDSRWTGAFLTNACFLEHTQNDGTWFYKSTNATNTSSQVWKGNFKTRESIFLGTGNVTTNNASYVFTAAQAAQLQMAGLCVQGCVYAPYAVTGTTTRTVTVYAKTITDAVAIQNKTIVFPSNGVTAASTYNPVICHNLDTNRLELFQTMNCADHGVTGIGHYVMKSVMTDGYGAAANMMTWSTPELFAVLPYGIGMSHVSAAAQRSSGICKNGKYYLPYQTRAILNPETASTVGDATTQYGVVIDATSKTVDREYLVRSAATMQKANVLTENGVELANYNDSNMSIGNASHVYSGANLTNAVVKAPTDILRVLYKYQMT